METSEKMTYSQALAELEEILKVLERSEEANLDLISKLVKRASGLMDFCRKQLH
jgi:exodeoxyribonuclease VII small subunit